MKIVREHINEKFTEKSDPVDDMGIGVIPKSIANKMVDDFLKYFKDTWNREFEKLNYWQISKTFEDIQDDIIIMNYLGDEAEEIFERLDHFHEGRALYQVFFVRSKKAAKIICSYYKAKELRKTIEHGWIILYADKMNDKINIEYVPINDNELLHKTVLKYAFSDADDKLELLDENISKIQTLYNTIKRAKDYLN